MRLTLILLAACGAPEPAAVAPPSPEAAPAEALPADHAAPPPALTLDVSDLIGGRPLTVTVRQGTAGAAAYIVRSPTAGTTCPPALGGLCVDLANPVILGTATFNAQGVATLNLPLPVDLPVGQLMRFQAASPAPGAKVSNTVTRTTRSECGDGLRQIDESCDDGNTIAGDGCSATCDAEYCGDGVVQANEECDDSNTIPGDGCDSFCMREGICGNGQVESGEACDDGNALAGDGCTPTCVRDCCAVNFRLRVISADLNPPRGGGDWDAQGIIAPFTYPDGYVEVSANGSVVGNTVSRDDDWTPNWNTITTITVPRGTDLTLRVLDDDPFPLSDEVMGTITISNQTLNNWRTGGTRTVSAGSVDPLRLEITDP